MEFGNTLGCVSPRSILAEAVPFAEVVGALHFLEPASRSVELEPAVARRIQVGRIGISGGEQLHAMLVERIDQRHKPRRFIAHFRAHYRNADEDHGMEAWGETE